MRHRTENAADLAIVLSGRQGKKGYHVSYVVTELQKAARALHRMDERACNEDLGCPKCEGNGCPSCAGTGLTTGKREARIVAKAQELVKPFHMRIYQQGDPRGWPIYLIPEESGDAREDESRYNQRGFAVCPH